MSALFNFQSFLTVVLLGICTCTYVKMQFPTILEHRTGFRGFFWKAARIALLPWIWWALACLLPLCLGTLKPMGCVGLLYYGDSNYILVNFEKSSDKSKNAEADQNLIQQSKNVDANQNLIQKKLELGYQWEEFPTIRFLQEEYGGTRGKSVLGHQSVFVADNCYGYIAGDTRIPEKFTEAGLDAWWIQEHILMLEIEYVKGEHPVAKNVVERIVLWLDFDKNGSDRILTGEIQQMGYQQQAFEKYKSGLIGFKDHSLMFEMQNESHQV
ncbi:hypothetical protein L7F22_069128 [Adiantum nelumboides]|nr:hypothetical protein [Adiantum nelumboides]